MHTYIIRKTIFLKTESSTQSQKENLGSNPDRIDKCYMKYGTNVTYLVGTYQVHKEKYGLYGN